MRFLRMFAACLALASCIGHALAAEHSKPDTDGQAFDAQSVASRVGDLPAVFLDQYSDKGTSSHKLTAQEQDTLRKSLMALSPLQQQVLQQHLESISFADGMPNNALTYPAKGKPGFFDITVRGGVLHETVSQLLNKKENACFSNETPDSRVVIDAGNMPALTYILLHESTHVVDASMGLVPDTTAKKLGHAKAIGGFTDGIWAHWNKPVAAYDSPALQVGCYHRNNKRVDIADAPAVYGALATTPFPSLYATSSAHEYIAELAAYSMLTLRLHQPYKITVYLHGVPVYTSEPMSNPLVKAQIPKTQIFYKPMDALLSPSSTHT
jgi:hypothetical protein